MDRCDHHCPERCGEAHTYTHCQQLIDVKLESCGHTVKSVCCKDTDAITCSAEVTESLICGHTKSYECFKREQPVVCISSCMKILACGHMCTRMCSELCADCKVCHGTDDHPHFDSIEDINFESCDVKIKQEEPASPDFLNLKLIPVG